MFQWYWMLFLVVFGLSLSGKCFSTESLACLDSNQYMKMKEAKIPRVEAQGNTVQDMNVTATFLVGLTGRDITGNITLTFDRDGDMKILIVKLSLALNNQTYDPGYFLIHQEMVKTRSFCAEFNYIHIPSTPKAVLKAEVYQLNMTSYGCNITEMAASELHNFIHPCHMYPVSTHSFAASRDACYYYREHYQDEIYMTLKADMISTNITKVRGYFTNVNPYSTVCVAVFPDDYIHEPHIPLWTSVVKVTSEGEVYCSVVTLSYGYTDFYAKMTVSCAEDGEKYEYISETASLRAQKIYDEDIKDNYDVSDSQDDDNGDDDDYPESIKEELVYGIVVGLLCVCCIVTVTVWLKIFHRRRQRSRDRRKNSYQDEVNLRRALQASTCNTSFSECRNNRGHFQKYDMHTKERKVMLLYHPDSDTHGMAVDRLALCLEKFDIRVHHKPEQRFGNWRDFAETVGEDYEDVIIILSNGLIELCELYRKRGSFVNNDSRTWNDLLEQRHGEYIPCVVLDKLRSLVQDKTCKVRTHFVIFSDTDDHDNSVAASLFGCRDTFCMHNCSDTVSEHDCSDTTYAHNSCGTVYEHDSSGTVCEHYNSGRVCEHDNNDTDCVHDCSDSVYRYILFHKAKNENLQYNTCSNRSVAIFDGQNQGDFLAFFKHFTFFDTKSTYFHAISTSVLKYLLLSESESDFHNVMHSFSLLCVLRNWK